MFEYMLYSLLILPIAYILRKPFLQLLIPRPIPGIPCYPDAKPITGDIPRMAKDVAKSKSFSYFFDKVAMDLGPIAQIRPSFFAKFVVLTDIAEIESVLSRHSEFDRATNTIDIFKGILPTGQISLPTNKMWRHHRRIVGPSMTSKYLAQSAPKANESIKNLIQMIKLKAAIAGDRAFAIENDMENATMDAICAMAFGKSWGIIPAYIEQLGDMKTAPTGPDGDAVFKLTRPALADSVWAVFETLPQMSFFPKLTHFFVRQTPHYRKHRTHLYNFFASQVAASRQQAKIVGAEEAVDLADNTLDLMVARELKGEDWMPENEMMDELYVYILAGTETSGVTISWWLKYMTNNPDIQRKLREDTLKRMPELQDRQPTYDDLNAVNMPYLEAVVHETLRMSRTAGGYTRETKQDAMVLGHVVPKGTTIVMPTVTSWEDQSTPIYAGGTKSEHPRRMGHWEAGTALKFIPERWLDSQGQFDLNAGPSLPFSGGQRACFGRNLALMEIRFFMCQLNLAFFFAPIDESQNSFQNYETVANHPTQCYIKPVAW